MKNYSQKLKGCSNVSTKARNLTDKELKQEFERLKTKYPNWKVK